MSVLTEPLVRGLPLVKDLDAASAANRLNQADPQVSHAVPLAASGGYPGQESRPFDPDQTTGDLDDGLLAQMIAKGPIYRATPGPTAAKV